MQLNDNYRNKIDSFMLSAEMIDIDFNKILEKYNEEFFQDSNLNKRDIFTEILFLSYQRNIE